MVNPLVEQVQKRPPRVVIVGGAGAMGKTFRRIFEAFTKDITVLDKETPEAPEKVVKNADIVLISVSINKTLPLIETLAPHLPPHSLFMDVTSLKETETATMMEFSDSRVEILGTHPLFGPYLELQGQVIALTPVRGTAWLEYIEKIFNETGLISVRITPEEHDKLMSFVQVLLHVILLSLIGTAQKLNLDDRLLKTISTPLYKIVWTLGERILNHDSKLYRHMALGNAHSFNSLKIFSASFEEFLTNIENQDGDAFEKQFRYLRQYLATSDKEKQEVVQQSQRLIDFFSKDFLKNDVFQKMLKELSEK